MKREERLYLESLQGFSRPAREFWDVQWIDFGKLAFDFRGDAAIYRYWDATTCVIFTMEMAQHALEVELRDEAAFLESYDAVYKAVDERFDIRGSDLANLVMMCLNNDGFVSKHRRKQYQYTVPLNSSTTSNRLPNKFLASNVQLKKIAHSSPKC